MFYYKKRPEVRVWLGGHCVNLFGPASPKKTISLHNFVEGCLAACS
jgi:hypothetical protein